MESYWTLSVSPLFFFFLLIFVFVVGLCFLLVCCTFGILLESSRSLNLKKRGVKSLFFYRRKYSVKRKEEDNFYFLL